MWYMYRKKYLPTAAAAAAAVQCQVQSKTNKNESHKIGEKRKWP